MFERPQGSAIRDAPGIAEDAPSGPIKLSWPELALTGALLFLTLDFAFHHFADERSAALTADQGVNTFAKPLRQANNGRFHS